MGLLDALSLAGDVLDTPGAMVRAGLVGENPLEAAINRSKRKSGRDVLEHYGLLGKNTPGLDSGDIAGFLAENLLDPTNLLGGGLATKAFKALGKAKQTNKAAKITNQAVNEANLFRDATRAKREELRSMAPKKAKVLDVDPRVTTAAERNAESMAQRANGFMPEEVAKLTKIVDENGKPLRTYHGTKHAFDQYDPAKFDPEALYGNGIYTTSDPLVASEYAAGKGQGPQHLIDKFHINRDRANKLHYMARDEAYKVAPNEFDELWSRLNGSLKPQLTHNEHMNAIDNLMDTLSRMGQLTPKAERAIEVAKKARSRAENARYIPENVRMQFIDARKPLEMEKRYDPKSIAGLTESETRDLSSGSLDTLFDLTSGRLDVREAIRPQLPTGERMYNFLGSKGVRDAGFDAIVHTGGQITGGSPHKVTIAFDPSQIYKPYIAPELINPIPRHNALAAFGHAVNDVPRYKSFAPRPRLSPEELHLGLGKYLPLEAMVPEAKHRKKLAAAITALSAHNALSELSRIKRAPREQYDNSYLYAGDQP